MRNNLGFEIPTEFKQPWRNALVGEIILFYPGGDPSLALPVLAIVTEALESPGVTTDKPVWQIQCKTIEPGRRPTDKPHTRHMGDPFWDENPLQLHKLGAWDFHPVHKLPFDNWVKAATARAESRRLREEESKSMPAEEIEAIDALERHGPKLSVIANDVGCTAESLKKLQSFWELFQKAKQSEFESKNSKGSKKLQTA